jgi:hypothetical protein
MSPDGSLFAESAPVGVTGGSTTLTASLDEPWMRAFPLRVALGGARFDRLRVERTDAPLAP